MKKLKRKINGETMEETKLPILLVSREEAEKKIQDQIDKGQQLGGQQINTKDELDKAQADFQSWSDFNKKLLSKLFNNSLITDDYFSISDVESYEYSTLDSLKQEINWWQKRVVSRINCLQGICEQLELYDEPSYIPQSTIGDKIFIGHGHSLIWRELKDFISERLELSCDEFNRVSTAGIGTKERLKGMLDQACMAFLVLTAEDEQTDGTLHARENVIHEAGLFQGRLGFEKAIILLEEGCEEFSNIHGLGQIRFPKGNIKAAFEEIREVLEREGVI